MIEIADVEFVQGDGEVVIIPVADSDDPNRDFRNPPSASNIRYVVADSHTPSDVLFEAPDSQIDVIQYGKVKPQDPNWPYPSPSNAGSDEQSYPRPSDSQDVIRVELKPDDTKDFAVTEGKFVDDLVHECEIDPPNVTVGGKVTIMQGSVTVKESATAT